MSAATRVLERLREQLHLTAPGVGGSFLAFLAAEMIERGRLPIMIAQSAKEAEALYRDLAFMLGLTDESAADFGLLFLGSDDKSPYEEYSPDGRAVMERINTLYKLAEEPKSIKALVLTPEALIRKHIPKTYFKECSEYILAGADLDRDELLRKLTASGYNAVNVVEDPGTYSVRGGIIDIFSPHSTRPVRIDLFGDEIDSLRLFNPSSQRTEAKVEDATLLPAREIFLDKERCRAASKAILQTAEEILVPSRKLRAALDDIQNGIHYFGIEALLPFFHPGGLVPLSEYLPKDDRIVYLYSNPGDIAERSGDLWTEAKLGYEQALASHQLVLPPEAHLADGDEVLHEVAKDASAVELPQVHVEDRPAVAIKYEPTDSLRAELLSSTRAMTSAEDVLHPLVHRLKRWRSEGLTTLIVCHTRGSAERLRAMMAPKGLNLRLSPQAFSMDAFRASAGQGARGKAQLRDRSVHAWLVLGELSQGFVHPEGYLVFVSEEEIFGKRMKSRRRRQPAAKDFVADLKDLKKDDFVVHVDFGIGKYLGLTKLAVGGVESDFLHIEYKGKDKLYMPVHRLRLVQKYVSASEGRAPNLDRLGGQSWAGTKRKVKDTLLKMAAELLRLYALRTSMEGYALPPPDETFRRFEAEFPFEPTADQQKAIDDVIAGLQLASPMDRLICGDVGYGKTEVAIRGTMMAVLGGKQVAVLVPTTVLAAQHYTVFKERFANYGVNVGIVSRFQTREEIKKSLEALKTGELDVVIGTHRLLNKDIQFKALALLVIDEEHRFGVRHKERLKKYRAQVHVLSMSATPIPRTLHMGFMGVRDMSMIATAPADRLAVKTEVHKFSEEILKEAITREIKRGGQCFVVHNRVASIGAFARMLEKLVPEARIAVGHGQMAEEQLEKVMVDFMNRDYNVLLSTTIIESGIDIPNANTIIINRADTMGLAQLYQLRGRVGRSKVRGFAHFLIPAGNLSKKARKRIAVLQRFTELGAGFQVASKDLEIRGAGNILGKQQSGTIASVGFEMYQALMKEAVDELQGAARKSLKEPEVQLPVPALIPDNYIKAPGERLAFYQRFNAADTDEATYDLLQEITDLYGTPPAEIENLAELMMIKQRLSRIAALGLDYGPKTKSMAARIVVRFDHEAPVLDPQQLVLFVQKRPKARKLSPEGKLVLTLDAFEQPQEILPQARDRLDDLVRLRKY